MVGQSAEGQNKMRRFLGLGMLFGGAMMAEAPALSQEPAVLIGCSAKVADAERLACYDAAVKGMSSEARAVSEKREKEAAVAAAAALAVSQAAQAEAARAEEAAKKDRFGKAGEAPEKEIEAGITEILRDALNKSIFILDNGQMWRQLDTFAIPTARPGAAVIVKRTALGGYWLNVKGSNRSVQVKRIN